MIPKIIHYVWLGGGKQSDTILRCIDSWRRILPEYEIKCWNEENFDISKAPAFVREAYAERQWAFASDYVRIWALNQYGGIYLDTDVEVRKPLDEFLECDFFIGTQTYTVATSKHSSELKTNLSIGVIGSLPQHPFLTDCMETLTRASFAKKGDKTEVSNYLYAKLLRKYGYANEDRRQHLEAGIEVYPTQIFGDRLSPTPADNCYTYHWGEMSWFKPKPRGAFYRLCWSLNLMGFYHWIEKMQMK